MPVDMFTGYNRRSEQLAKATFTLPFIATLRRYRERRAKRMKPNRVRDVSGDQALLA